MTRPFNFANDPKLPPAIAARMQAVADQRATDSRMDTNGNTHRTQEKTTYVNDLLTHIANGKPVHEVEGFQARKGVLKTTGKW